jgi:hypothetical protein
MLDFGRLVASALGRPFVVLLMFFNALGKPDAKQVISNPWISWNSQKRENS